MGCMKHKCLSKEFSNRKSTGFKCYSISEKNNKYFVNYHTRNEVNRFSLYEMDELIRAEAGRKYDLNIVTSCNYLIATVYWCIIPDVVKYILCRTFNDYLREPARRLHKQLITLQLHVIASTNGKTAPLKIGLKYWHSNFEFIDHIEQFFFFLFRVYTLKNVAICINFIREANMAIMKKRSRNYRPITIDTTEIRQRLMKNA